MQRDEGLMERAGKLFDVWSTGPDSRTPRELAADFALAEIRRAVRDASSNLAPGTTFPPPATDPAKMRILAHVCRANARAAMNGHVALTQLEIAAALDHFAALGGNDNGPEASSETAGSHPARQVAPSPARDSLLAALARDVRRAGCAALGGTEQSGVAHLESAESPEQAASKLDARNPAQDSDVARSTRAPATALSDADVLERAADVLERECNRDGVDTTVPYILRNQAEQLRASAAAPAPDSKDGGA